MSVDYFKWVIIGLVPIWLATAVFSALMVANRKPDSPLSPDLVFRSDLLTERGQRARRWAMGLAIFGAAYLIGGAIIGIIFFPK